MVVTGVLLLEEMDVMLVEVVQDIMVDQVEVEVQTPLMVQVDQDISEVTQVTQYQKHNGTMDKVELFILMLKVAVTGQVVQ